MRHLVVFALCSLAAIARAASNLPPVPPVEDIITMDDARTHLEFLAADSMQGRNTPSPQLELAAQYIAARFKEYGLLPLHGSYLQPYTVSRLNLSLPTAMHVTRNGVTTALEPKIDFVPFEVTGDMHDSADVVFAGYGITAPEYGWDDYKDIDVKGKIVVVFRHEPCEKGDDTTFFRGKRWTRYSEIRSKARNAAAHGAVGLIAVTDPLNHMLLKPEGYPWPSLFFQSISGSDLPLTLDLRGMPSDTSLPAVQCGEKLMAPLFGSTENLTAIQRQMDSTRTPHSFAIVGTRIAMTITLTRTPITVHNVVGYLPGDANDSAHIVIGAHYDHVGTRHATKPEEDTIYNGADDNASGTTGLLEVARAFTRSGLRPHRGIVFCAFSGEEKGLYGSRAYVVDPAISLEHCVAMLNMDMIGRNAPDSLELGGAGHSPVLTALAEQEDKQVGLLIKESDDFIGRSDQASFSLRRIPVLFYFTGEHKDYHQVTDSPDKIDYRKLVRVATLCFRTAWDIANMDGVVAFK